jgi:3-hydroxyisobutyrate dehydrogenase-like beta-hydroxyacid dehydrogenase
MEIVSEAHVLAEKSGLNSQLFESFLGKKFGDLMHSDSTRLTTGGYIPERGTHDFYQDHTCVAKTPHI